MSWRNRNSWLVLSAGVALIAWLLTRWITHVNYGSASVVTVAFDERAPFQVERFLNGFSGIREQRTHLPEALLTSRGNALFLVTPTTRSITIRGINVDDVSCDSLNEQRWSAALLLGAGKNVILTPIPVEKRSGEVFIPIPNRIQAELHRSADARGAITCHFVHDLATSPTFTERAITVRAQTRPGQAVLLDVSALENIDDLRFSGGLQAPLGGERVRLLYGGDNVMSVEWTDVAALERRDIILVLIGAISAIAAAMAIEAIRPVVERRSKSE
jgi:hypothetical protein